MKNARMLLICLIVMIATIPCKAEGSNGVIQRCGQDAVNFLRWFCIEPTFKFPFPFHYMRSKYNITWQYAKYLKLNRVFYSPVFQHVRGPYKNVYPFQSAAITCCKYGCQESTYHKMCMFHKKIQHCERRRKHHRTQAGRRKGVCRLTRLNWTVVDVLTTGVSNLLQIFVF